MPEALEPSTVQRALETTWLGRTYFYLAETDSTNALLKSQVLSRDSFAPPTGTVILTDFQKKGRGRLNRSWEAPPGTSLLFSVLLRPDWSASRFSWLAMLAGLSVSEAVENHTELAPRLKWLNDGVVYHNGRWQKYCGVLQEAAIAMGDSLSYAILGVGVNVNIPEEQLPPADFPATSLLVASGQSVSRLDLFASILSRLEYHFERAEKGHSPREAWQDRLIFMDKSVVLTSSASRTHLIGKMIGADEEGRLLIKDGDGKTHAVVAGDLTLREYLEP